MHCGNCSLFSTSGLLLLLSVWKRILLIQAAECSSCESAPSWGKTESDFLIIIRKCFWFLQCQAWISTLQIPPRIPHFRSESSGYVCREAIKRKVLLFPAVEDKAGQINNHTATKQNSVQGDGENYRQLRVVYLHQ